LEANGISRGLHGLRGFFLRETAVTSWNLLPPAPGTSARGGARGARGTSGVPEGTAAPAPGGRGARGARGGGPPANAATPAPVRDTPEKALAAALDSANGVGYLWSSESTGYSLRYAYRFPQADGGERIILATDRRLGDHDDSWKPAAGPASGYDFSVIELRLNARHEGEGKASVTGKVSIDTTANTIALENYSALPLTLKNVKPRIGN
jgi:hypothetical protein